MFKGNKWTFEENLSKGWKRLPFYGQFSPIFQESFPTPVLEVKTVKILPWNEMKWNEKDHERPQMWDLQTDSGRGLSQNSYCSK